MMKTRIDKLRQEHTLSKAEWLRLLSDPSPEIIRYAAEQARDTAREYFGNSIYFRGIVEISSYCKNNCCYCGLRRSAGDCRRYRLTPEQILTCCRSGYSLGYRSFVLQGGEDAYFTDERVCALVRAIKSEFPDCAVTLSLGERSRESYRTLYEAGADRYLLRHETASKPHYERLHPAEMRFDNRMRCLEDLKQIGYQCGCGMMVGSPYQTADTLAEDMLFITRYQPHMIGIGPFQPHHDTPFRDKAAGSVELTLYLLSLCRLLLPTVLLPATTALDCGGGQGRQRAILAGANVVMPNLSPMEVREGYQIYDNKPGLSLDAAENLRLLKEEVEAVGYRMVIDRGDHISRRKEKNCGTE